jgi:asparagine synthase (glutamine-hydrolysing)
MCGIAGIYSLNKSRLFNLDASVNLIKHRGPDASGIFQADHVAFGHTRLSILDLSDAANQPLHSHNNRYVMVYNGEIYNYREIASNLKYISPNSSPIYFKTSSDSEAILEAYSFLGNNFLEQLNGMFAIAIYDKEEDSVTLIRDRIGIKPLFYFWDGELLMFASELKVFQEALIDKLEINPKAVFQFLHQGFISAPDTIYKNVYKLEAGSLLTCKGNSINTYKYWNLGNQLSEEVIKDEKAALVRLSDLLSSSVQFQLRSDVPYGVFLSGGIDSSLITALSVRLSGTKINTFSIGFEENRFNESVHAKKIAQYLSTNHTEFIVSFKDALPLFDDILNVFDEPFSDSSAIPTMIVSRLAKQYVSVALSGEGGDELFHGYGAYKWSERLSNPIIGYNRKTISDLLKMTGNNRYKRVGLLMNVKNVNNKYSHVFSQEQYMFSQEEIMGMWADEKLKGSVELWLEELNKAAISNRSVLNKRVLTEAECQSFFDMKNYLQDDLLVKVDRSSMRYALETRVPYLDHRVVEFALNISPTLKIKNGESKFILKEILYQYLPKNFFERPKQGFAIPLESWLKNELSYLIHDKLGENIPFIHTEYVKDLIKRFKAGEGFLYNRIWLVIILERFFAKISLKH